MKYKQVRGFMNYHDLEMEERRNAMNYLGKDLIHRTENRYLENLKMHIGKYDQQLYQICNLFQYMLSFENYSSCYNQPLTNYDQ